MKTSARFRCTVCAIVPILIGVGVQSSIAMAEGAKAPTLAIADFDFKDTSGEIRDQSAIHQKRLSALVSTVREQLSEDRRVDVTSMDCGHDQCTPRGLGLATLSRQAKAAGASHLLIGEVHKMSTLVGWVKYALLDLQSNRPTCDRFLTYRGDTDEAWHRAAKFVVQDVERNCLP
ncbi:DUF2380 domain-containing protein [Ciceribacter azotifigens]|uniref:DUF2380 domain-containing protein n=1 Tax=Ciceribacter azotifigens TaxID=2069303 RepID=UPI003A877510